MGLRIVGGIGRSLIAVGVVVLLFVAYQLWGTGILEARSQDELRDQLAEALADAERGDGVPPAPQTSEPSGPPGTVDPDRVDVIDAAAMPRLPLPEEGDPVGEIRLPTIGVTRVVVSGTSPTQLARGPGHHPETPLPGQAGNVAIAGHRTTFGQPFHNVDKLEPGDQILTTTIQGEFVYEVEGTEIVGERDTWVLEDRGDDRLTLIACHPKYSLARRIIVHAVLVGSPAPEIEGQAEARQAAIERAAGDPDRGPTSIDRGLTGTDEPVGPAAWWAGATTAVVLVSWRAHRSLRRLRDRADPPWSTARRLVPWSPYAVGLPVFLVTLFVFFGHVTRLLPGRL